jgi:osmotically inducible protein OsmC
MVQIRREMNDVTELPFDAELEWSGSGSEGAGTIFTDDLELEYSAPVSMGGRGIGSNPEELLVCAVGACYSATLNGLLRRAGLPASLVRIAATGTVTGYPAQARFARLVVSPTILDGDASRRAEYEEAAEAAHMRCFIGRTIAGAVDYEVGAVTVVPMPVAA